MMTVPRWKHFPQASGWERTKDNYLDYTVPQRNVCAVLFCSVSLKTNVNPPRTFQIHPSFSHCGGISWRIKDSGKHVAISSEVKTGQTLGGCDLCFAGWTANSWAEIHKSSISEWPNADNDRGWSGALCCHPSQGYSDKWSAMGMRGVSLICFLFCIWPHGVGLQ